MRRWRKCLWDGVIGVALATALPVTAAWAETQSRGAAPGDSGSWGWSTVGLAAGAVGAAVLADVVTGGAVSGPLVGTIVWLAESVVAVEGVALRNAAPRSVAAFGGLGLRQVAPLESEPAAGLRVQSFVTSEAAPPLQIEGQSVPCLRVTVCGRLERLREWPGARPRIQHQRPSGSGTGVGGTPARLGQPAAEGGAQPVATGSGAAGDGAMGPGGAGKNGRLQCLRVDGGRPWRTMKEWSQKEMRLQNGEHRPLRFEKPDWRQDRLRLEQKLSDRLRPQRPTAAEQAVTEG